MSDFEGFRSRALSVVSLVGSCCRALTLIIAYGVSMLGRCSSGACTCDRVWLPSSIGRAMEEFLQVGFGSKGDCMLTESG